MKIPYTSADHILIPAALHLFNTLNDKRLLIRLVGLRFSNLVHGNYQINFHGSLLPSGVYYYQLKTGNFVNTKKNVVD